MKYTDEQFVAKLREYLSQFSEGQRPIVPVMRDRVKTLALPCFANMPDELKKDLLS